MSQELNQSLVMLSHVCSVVLMLIAAKQATLMFLSILSYFKAEAALKRLQAVLESRDTDGQL